jgi:hypothetical protein
MADHADSRKTKLYDRRGQKVLREDVERIYWHIDRTPWNRHIDHIRPFDAAQLERPGQSPNGLRSVHLWAEAKDRRGDLLVELDPRDFQVNCAIAAASLASARSKVAESAVKKIASQEAQIQLASAQYNAALAAQNQEVWYRW